MSQGEERLEAQNDPHLAKLKTGLKERLEGQALHERLASSTALKGTFESPWWEHDKPDALELSLKAGDHQTTREDVQDVYKALEGMVGDAIEKADEEGKRLLIVAGGQHYDRTSMLATALVVEAAVNNGVKQLFDETSEENISEYVGKIRNGEGRANLNAGLGNEAYIIDDMAVKYPELNIEGVDNLSEKEKKAEVDGKSTAYSRFQEREDAMLDLLDDKMKGHAVLMAGGAHLQGLIENTHRPEDVEILAFNTTHKAFIFNDKDKEQFAIAAMTDERENYSRGQGVREGEVTMLIIPGKGVGTPENALEGLEIVREMDRDEGKWSDKVKASQQKFDEKQSMLKRGLEYVARYSGGAMPYPLDKGDKGKGR